MGAKSILCTVLLAVRLWADAPGMPFLQNFPPKIYGAEAQNWALAQDGQGVLHAGNNLGVLSYDGARWRLLPTPGQTVVRSLATDSTGRVYVGAVGEVGFLEQGRFVSLSERLPQDSRSFSDVWNCYQTPRGVLFQAREQLMLWDGKTFHVWKARTTFHGAFTAEGRILVRQREVGLQELVGRELVLLQEGERFATESLWSALDTPGGAVLVSRNLGLWRLQGQRLTPMPSDVGDWLKENAVYTGAVLGDGTLALGSLGGGVAFLSREGHLIGVLNRNSGLPSDNVKRLLVDRQGALWAAFDNGLARIAWPSPLTFADERSGLRGTVWGLHRHQGRLYAATGQGAAILDAEAPAFRPRWLPVQGLAVQCLSFLSVGDQLLLASSQGVLEVRGNRTFPVRPSSATAMSLLASRRWPGRVYAGVQGGLAVLRKENGRWVDEGLVPGVNDDCYNLLEDGTGDLWIGTGALGVRRVRFGEDGRADVRSYRDAEGLAGVVQPLLFALEDRIGIGSRQGIHRYDAPTDRWIRDTAFEALLQSQGGWVKALRAMPDGRLWLHLQASDRRRTGVAVPDGKGGYRWEGAGLETLVDTPVECLLEEAGGRLWLGGPEGLICREPPLGQTRLHAAAPLLHRIQSGRGVVLGAEAAAVLPYADHTLRFEFALPSFGHPGAIRYQTRLEGTGEGWSAWTQEPQKEYIQLREGRYRFRVRARDASGEVGEEATFSFRIRPPWSRTWWALGLYGIGAAGLVTGLLRWRLRFLERRNSDLAARVSEATALLQAQASELVRLNQEKNQFIGMVAHDLRNPLQAVLLTAEMLEDGEDADKRRLWARQVGEEAREMSHLVERFLDIAAIDSGRVEPRLEPFPLLQPLEHLVARYRWRIAQKRLQFRCVFPDPGPIWVSDARFLKAVVDNLLSNAFKFTPAGGEVLLRVEVEPDGVRLTVQDQGPGFSEEDRAKLFTPYTALSARPTGGETSTGLGLSIVKRFVEALHGTIHVESTPGGGASVQVMLPPGRED